MGRQLLLSLLLASLGTLLHVNVRWADARPANVEATSFSEGADSTGPVLAEEPNLELQDEADVENYPRHLQLQHNAAASEQPLASKLTALTRQVISKRPANPEGDTLTKSVDDFTKDLLEKTGNRTMRVCGNKIHALMKSVCQLVGKFVAVLKNADEVKFILRKLKGEHSSVLNACCYSSHGCAILQALPFAEEKCFNLPKQRRSAQPPAA